MLNIDFNARTFYFYFKFRLIFGCRAADYFAGRHVKFGAVTGTHHDFTSSIPFEKVASHMSAFAADGVILAVNIGDQDILAAQCNPFHFSFRDFSGLCDFE